jgi:hypothetical protein
MSPRRPSAGAAGRIWSRRRPTAADRSATCSPPLSWQVAAGVRSDQLPTYYLLGSGSWYSDLIASTTCSTPGQASMAGPRTGSETAVQLLPLSPRPAEQRAAPDQGAAMPGRAAAVVIPPDSLAPRATVQGRWRGGRRLSGEGRGRGEGRDKLSSDGCPGPGGLPAPAGGRPLPGGGQFGPLHHRLHSGLHYRQHYTQETWIGRTRTVPGGHQWNRLE